MLKALQAEAEQHTQQLEQQQSAALGAALAKAEGAQRAAAMAEARQEAARQARLRAESHSVGQLLAEVHGLAEEVEQSTAEARRAAQVCHSSIRCLASRARAW